MENESIIITKSSGDRVKFSLNKLRSSLKRTGADKETIDQIIDKVRDELYQGISTKEIYNRKGENFTKKNDRINIKTTKGTYISCKKSTDCRFITFRKSRRLVSTFL